MEVTGRITTNGSAGTVSYQWLFRPDRQPPQPLSQSVVAGQDAVYVTVAVEGQGHGSASQAVTLQVLGPDPRTASAARGGQLPMNVCHWQRPASSLNLQDVVPGLREPG